MGWNVYYAMYRLVKILVWLCLSIIILSLITIFVLIVLFKTTDPNLYKNRVSAFFQKQTGIQIQVAGDFKILFLPKPKIIMQDVLFHIPLDEKAVEQIALHAQKLELGIQFLSYLKQDIQIKTLFFQNALVQVLKNTEKKQELFFDEVFANLQQTAHGFELKNVSIALQGGMLEGELSLQKNRKKFFIKGNLQARSFNFDKWIESAKAKPEQEKKDLKPEDYKNVSLDLALELSNCQLWEGKLNGNLQLKTHTKKPFISGTLTGKDFAVTKFWNKPSTTDIPIVKWKNYDVDVKLQFSDVTLPAGKIKGEIQFNTNKKILVTGNLEANKLVLGSNAKKTHRKIPDFLIPMSLFQDVAYQGQIKIEALEVGNILLQDVNFSLLHQDKTVQIKNFRGKIYDGRVEGNVNLKKLSSGRVAMQTSLTGKHWDLDKIVTPGGDSAIRGGRFDVQFKGKGEGKSFQEILGKWRGTFFWSMTDATVRMRRVQDSLSDVFFSFLNVLNPFERDKSATTIHCAKIFFTINQGIARADKGIGIETNVLNALGTGQLNLKNEEMVFDFVIREKKGVDIDIGNFNNYVQLHGTLANPQMRVQTQGLLEGGFSIFSAFSTGGLSLIAEQIFELLEKEEHACNVVTKR